MPFVLLTDPEPYKTSSDYDSYGLKKFMGKEFMGVIRTTYLLDKKGQILKVWNNVKAKDHAIEVLETLKRIVK